jgi:hypothetical protein
MTKQSKCGGDSDAEFHDNRWSWIW